MLVSLLSIVLLLVLLSIGTPMLAALLASVAFNFVLNGQWGLMVTQQTLSGIDSFTLISLPLFVLSGVIMNAGGISERLFDFARALVGWMRGGLAQVDVLTSMFMGGMIGSSTADLAGSGSILIPAMKREGYSPEFAAAVSASSSGIGPLIPPSSPAILYSAITGTSLGALFIAGLIPGILLGLAFMATVGVLAFRGRWKRHGAFAMGEVFRTGGRAIFAFGMPGLIIAGLVAGAFTPTEAGAFAVAYAVLLSVFVYKALDMRTLYRAGVAALQLTGELLIIVGLSYALGSSLSNAHVPQALGSLIDVFAFDNAFLRLVVLMLLAIIAGMFLDPLIPVLLPVILPTLLLYQVDLIHFGVLMVMAVVIGQLTPPMAIALIITGRIAGTDQLKIFVANMPFLLVILAFTLLLMLVPELATWLPSLMQQPAVQP